MSSSMAPSRARVRIAEVVQHQRARLAVVPGRTSAPRVPFAALVLTVLGLGLVGLLVLNTSLQQGAFHARDLEDRAQVLAERQQALQVEVARLREPQRVAARAAELGMVANDSPAFLRLSDHRVLGRAAPAAAGSAPDFLTPPRAAAAGSPPAGRPGGGSSGRDQQEASQ